MGRSQSEKDQLHNEMECEYDLQNTGNMVLGLEDFDGHVEKRIDGFEGVHEGNAMGESKCCGKKIIPVLR